IGQLANADRLPFVATADCLNGFFVHPYTDATIAEALLRKPDGGAVAVWSSSSLGTAGDQALLFAALFRELTANPPPTLGQAIVAATAAAARDGVSPELLSTFILFGDPALRLRLIPAARHYLPLVIGSSPRR
ncbi:MAG: C25 family cysteine peptidase, partial [Anaerolineae bacterium]